MRITQYKNGNRSSGKHIKSNHCFKRCMALLFLLHLALGYVVYTITVINAGMLNHCWCFLNLPVIPIHTTVFLSESVARFWWNKIVTSLANIVDVIPENTFGEHMETMFLLFCFPSLNTRTSSLHAFLLDNIMCSKLTSISVRFPPKGLAVHLQFPKPGAPSGKAGEVK